MSIEKVKAYFAQFGMEQRVLEFEVSSATVELAAQAAGVEPKRIAKTLSFLVGDRCILIVAAGDARVDNKKYKDRFGVKVYLDESLQRFETVFPAAGSANSAIELTIPELEQYSKSDGWVDVCKDWRTDAEG